MNQVVKREQQLDIELIKKTICKGASDQELALFAQVCQRTGLDPFARQIYSVPMQGQRQTLVSIDGMRLIAERSGKYAGQLGAYWCDDTGEWKDVWLKNTPPIAAKVGVLRHDFKEPIWAVARYNEYARGQMWQKMPALMNAKVAECLALRRGFPLELSGLYAVEEMQQAEIEVDVTPINPVTAENITLKTGIRFNKDDQNHIKLLLKFLEELNIDKNDFRQKFGEFLNKNSDLTLENLKERLCQMN